MDIKGNRKQSRECDIERSLQDNQNDNQGNVDIGLGMEKKGTEKGRFLRCIQPRLEQYEQISHLPEVEKLVDVFRGGEVREVDSAIRNLLEHHRDKLLELGIIQEEYPEDWYKNGSQSDLEWEAVESWMLHIFDRVDGRG
jgi:hypothetical protein